MTANRKYFWAAIFLFITAIGIANANADTLNVGVDRFHNWTAFFTATAGPVTQSIALTDTSGERNSWVAGDEIQISGNQNYAPGSTYYLNNIAPGSSVSQACSTDWQTQFLADGAILPTSDSYIGGTPYPIYDHISVPNAAKFQIHFFGSVTCSQVTGGQVNNSNQIKYPIDITKDLGLISTPVSARAASVQSVQGPSSIKISTTQEKTYNFNVVIADKDHVVDEVKLSPFPVDYLFQDGCCTVTIDRTSNSKNWKKTPQGWNVSLQFRQPVVSTNAFGNILAIDRHIFGITVSQQHLAPRFNVEISDSTSDYQFLFRK